MILRIPEARVCGPHSLRLTFNDGTTKQVDVRPLLEGPIFKPLRDPAYFASVSWTRFAARSSGLMARISPRRPSTSWRPKRYRNPLLDRSLQ